MTDHLLWCDLETTGTDESKDCIIEVGCILTTTDLEPLGEFSQIVMPTAEGLGRMMLNPVVREMHEANGLLAELLAPEDIPSIHAVAYDLLCWVQGLGARQSRLVLAGSGVGHFDRRFIARYMPKVNRFMRYWVIDIGTVRRAHSMWVGTEVSTAYEAKTHRALDDIRCHLEEARDFKSLWSPAG